MSIDKEIRNLMSRCSRLEQQVAKLPTRIGNSAGGGGGSKKDNDKIWTEAISYPEIEEPQEDNITLLARVTDGPQKDQIYKIAYTNPEDEEEEPELYWACISEQYDADTKEGLVNNAYVQKFAVGRVGSIYYRRNAANNGWEALNEFE